MRVLIGLVLCFVFSTSQVAGQEGAQFDASVASVLDGDTIKVRTPSGTEMRVRLHGIDAPEISQNFGKDSKDFLTNALARRQVRIVVRDKDRYGRYVAEVVTPEGLNINQHMVRNGQAWWYEEYAKNDTALQQAQAQARMTRNGLWKNPNAVAPWEYRKSPKRHGDDKLRSATSSLTPSTAPSASQAQSKPAKVTAPKAPSARPPSPSPEKTVWVEGYTKKDGTYVRGHWRKPPKK